MTGCYPPRIGFGDFDGRWVLFPGQPIGLNPSELTIARMLKQKGYATKIVGKWHCGDQPEFLPTNYGFDSYYGIPYSNDMGRQVNRNASYPPLPLVRDTEVIQAQPDQAALTERYTEECVRFIRDNRHQPFFLYFAHMHVHRPIYTPESFLKRSRNGRYGAAVNAIDWSVGVLRHELRRLGLEQNTIIIFTSDNGSRVRGEGGSNGPLRGTKGTTWEGGLRVPCIVCWPDRIPTGRVSSELTTSMDFLPTFAEIVDYHLDPFPTIDGKSILPILLEEPNACSPHRVFAYYKKNTLEAVRMGDWKLHLRKDNEAIQELYNLREDIGESCDVAAQHPEIVKKLEAAADEIRAELGDEALGIRGQGCRPHGRVPEGRTLTTYDPEHPYIQAEYDLSDAG